MQLNLRKFPDELGRQVKAKAALAGMTLPEYLSWVLQEIFSKEGSEETRKRVRKGEAGSRKGKTFPDETQAGTQDTVGQLAARGETKATASGPVASSPFKASNEIPHNKKRGMAATREGDAAQKTCAYEPSGDSVAESHSELGQAEAQGPSARHDGVAHRSLPRRARPEGLSAPSGKAPKCGLHGHTMKDFGNMWLCEGPPQHKELK